jgi:hypothetical protein
MASLRTTFENTFAAAAFAEHGEHDTARDLAGRPIRARRSLLETLRSTFAAVAFAEHGEHDTALALAGIARPATTPHSQTLEQFMREVGLVGVPAYFGVAQVEVRG